ncbi:hypothetical protein E8E13_007115 [Curvularia kusanoi]|uniref:Uncharacterized protein n=1 Tax=Curvularia kusanoi TaxID=90978 RepID=A0A9P4W9L9_CURKU|nr:hypothetical protein E8E13_007115 [Curvularia kusanoi]
MLPEHSQQLLRAARSGRTIKPPAPPEDDDNEMKEEEPEHKEVSTGFTVKKYVKVARHNEAPEPEYLAKRRKGLPSQYINGQVQAPLRETKVKKLDAEGNVAVYKVLAPEGQAVEGEVAPTDAAIEVAPVIAAPGTVVEGVGVVNAEGIVVANDILQQTPPRRRPPPPKKKKGKHIPRVGSRVRKRVDFVEGAEGQGTPAPTTGGDIPAIRELKTGEGDSVEPSDRDTPMGEAGDDDESGEEGSEEDDQDHEDETPASPSRAPVPSSSGPVVEMTDAPEIAAPAEPIIVTEAATTIPLESLQPSTEIEQPIPLAAPEPEESTVEAPITGAPVVGVSAAETPATEAPVVEAPIIEAPIIEAPITEAPITEAPITEAPITEAPIAEVPTIEAPVGDVPVIISDEPGNMDVSTNPATHDEDNLTSQPPTSATTIETSVPEPLPSEPLPDPVAPTEAQSVPAGVNTAAEEPAEEPTEKPIEKPTGEPAEEPAESTASATQPESTKAPSQEQNPDPTSAGTPDLLGSLEAELDKKE